MARKMHDVVHWLGIIMVIISRDINPIAAALLIIDMQRAYLGIGRPGQQRLRLVRNFRAILAEDAIGVHDSVHHGPTLAMLARGYRQNRADNDSTISLLQWNDTNGVVHNG